MDKVEPVKPSQAKPPPALNIPGGVLVFGAALVMVHTLIAFLNPSRQIEAIATFAFVPAAYDWPVEQLYAPFARYWSPVTYGFLHADWTHLGTNLIWLLAFGSPVAKRFGLVRFGLFLLVAIVAGAGAHWLAYVGDQSPLVGASGAVSGCFGAAARFAFEPGSFASDERLMRPARSLLAALTNRVVVTFIVVWLGLNWIAGSGVLPVAGEGASIAWEAHVGGFAVGLFLFALFDPVRK